MRISSQVAVVTGASSGIGAELARQLAGLGVRVGLTARRAEPMEELAARIRAQGGTAAVAAADATDQQATRAAIARLEQELGPVDLLIANAGVGYTIPPHKFSAAKIEEMVRVNLLGPVYAIEAVLPGMLERRRGHIVGISSLAAYRGLPGTGGYCATKSGLSTLLESLRVEVAPRGIAVTSVHPGYVRTPMTAGADHAQPFIMNADRAARIILKGIAARRKEVNFPWPLASFLALVRHFPNAVYDPLCRLIMGPRPPAPEVPKT